MELHLEQIPRNNTSDKDESTKQPDRDSLEPDYYNYGFEEPEEDSICKEIKSLSGIKIQEQNKIFWAKMKTSIYLVLYKINYKCLKEGLLKKLTT